VLADPALRFYTGPGLTSQNDDWENSASLANAFTLAGAFALPANSKDSALVAQIPAGAYSGHVFSQNSSSGIALVEAYEMGQSAAKFTNFSTLAQTGTGAGTVALGFVISGTGPKSVLVRGIGPALVPLGVNNAVLDPKIDVVTATGVPVASNDDWPASLSQTFQQAGAFPLPAGSKDAALVVTLPPGSYSAVVSGNATGTALAEVYLLPDAPINVSIPASGDLFSVHSTVGVIFNAPWISSTFGTDAVTVSVAPNTSSTARAGVITAGDQTYTVSQGGLTAPAGTTILNPVGTSQGSAVSLFDRQFFGTRIQVPSTFALSEIRVVGLGRRNFVFVAIIKLPSLDSFPTSTPVVGISDASEVAYSTLFALPITEDVTTFTTTTIPALTTLQPGAYAVVFGAGLFGSPNFGNGGLLLHNGVTGSDSISWVDGKWRSGGVGTASIALVGTATQ
jgi:hypothetical protein